MISYITLVCLFVRKVHRSESRGVYFNCLRSMIDMAITVQHVVIFVALFPGMFAGMSTILFFKYIRLITNVLKINRTFLLQLL